MQTVCPQKRINVRGNFMSRITSSRFRAQLESVEENLDEWTETQTSLSHPSA